MGKTLLKSIGDLPKPPGLPVLGHVHHLKGKNVHDVIAGWVQDLGTLFSINLMGKQFIVSADPDFNLKVMKSRPEQFRRYYKINAIMSEMGIHGVFNAEGEQWKVHRKHFTEALSVKNVKGYFGTLDYVTGKLLTRLTKMSASGEGIIIKEEMERFAVDITTEIAFGHNVNTLDDNDDKMQAHFDTIFPMLYKRIVAVIPTWRYVKSGADRKLDVALNEIEKEMQYLINLGRQQLKDDPSLIDAPANFLQALLVTQSSNPSFTDKEVFGNVFSMLVGGEDTTANSISWMLYYLALNPEFAEKARKEAIQVYGDASSPIAFEQIKQLEYTDAIVTEALRMKPVTSTLYLTALENTVIDELEIEKGMNVILQNREAQTNERYFKDADSFIPDRWISGRCPVDHAHSPDVMRTFGGGARYCPGMNLAMNEMKMAVSMICKNFTIELAVKQSEVTETFSFTMEPDNLFIRLKPRD